MTFIMIRIKGEPDLVVDDELRGSRDGLQYRFNFIFNRLSLNFLRDSQIVKFSRQLVTVIWWFGYRFSRKPHAFRC